MAVAGVPHECLEASRNAELSPAQRRRAEKLIATRISTRAPLAYLLGEAWLGEYRFHVDERAIVPRSFIAELMRERLHPWVRNPRSVKTALDMCTGSGCLAVLLALAFRGARVDAVDASHAALAVARRNIRDYRLERRVRTVRSDLFEKLAGTRYDLILANPPYVTDRGMRSLPMEYRHEPVQALSGGSDGLDLVRRILREAPTHLVPRGLLIVEIGHNRPALERAFPRLAFTWVETSAGDGLVFMLTREQLLRA